MAVEGVGFNSNLYFSAAQTIASNQAKQALTEANIEKTKKKSFASTFQKTQMETELMKSGFPKEIAGMETEEAAIYLRDQADIAADILKEKQTPESFAEYRKRITQFIRYLEKNNFEVKKKQRRGFNSRGKPLQPQFTIVAINQKLDEMAAYLLSTHKKAGIFSMLGKVDEIKGLIIDLMAV